MLVSGLPIWTLLSRILVVFGILTVGIWRGKEGKLQLVLRRKTDRMLKRTKEKAETRRGRKVMGEVLGLTERISNSWSCLRREEVSCPDARVVLGLESKRSVSDLNNQELGPRGLVVEDFWHDRRGRSAVRMREDLEEERIIRDVILTIGEMTNLGQDLEDVEKEMRREDGDLRIGEEMVSISMMTEEEMAGGMMIEDLREDAMNRNG